jgi:hypothetical protein
VGEHFVPDADPRAAAEHPLLKAHP